MLKYYIKKGIMSVTIANCEKMADNVTLKNAYKLFRDNKIISVTNIEVNEHIGSLYEGKIKLGKKVYTLCFAIAIDGVITCDECFCYYPTNTVCEHFLAIFLFMKYRKNISIDKRVFNPVRVLLSSAESSPEGVNAAVDGVFNRYIVNNKISEWYMLCAIEGLVFSCMCAESKEKGFLERTALYAVALSKVDKLLSLSVEKYPRMLINHAKALVKLTNAYLSDKLPNVSLNDCKEAFQKLYNASKKVKNWIIKYNVLGLLVQFCETPSLRTFLELDIKSKIANQKNEEKKSDLRMLYCMILRSYSIKKASDYIEKNIKDASFRRMAIDLNIANGDYREAKILAKDGLVQDKGKAKNMMMWTSTMYDIVRHQNDNTAMKKYARKMLLLGDFDYFTKYKNIFEENEWGDALNELISHLKTNKKQREIYLQIIIEENLQDELIAFCKTYPEKIANYYPYVNVANYKDIESYLESYYQKLKTTDVGKDELHFQKVALDKLKNKIAR